jgi:molybdopterin converting factor small subunit
MTITIHYKGQIATELGLDSEELVFDQPLPLIETLKALSNTVNEKVNDFLFDEQGLPRRTLLVIVNDEQVIDFENTLITEDCVISLLPPIAGG